MGGPTPRTGRSPMVAATVHREVEAVPLQIVCAERSGKDARHRHIDAVGIATGNTIIRFHVKTVRQLIKKGTVSFFCLGPNAENVKVRRYKCACGRKTIRTIPDDITDQVLSALPTCRD